MPDFWKDATHSNRCIDICHDFVGDDFHQYNDLGDALIIINIGLLITAIAHSEHVPLRRFVVLFVVMMLFREILSLVTFSESNVNRANRPLLGGDHRWYILSGHLFTSIIITYLVGRSNINVATKITSVALSMGIFFVQIVTHEHYSKDMMLTLLICLLLIKAYS